MMDHMFLKQDGKAGACIFRKNRGLSKKYTKSRDGDRWSWVSDMYSWRVKQDYLHSSRGERIS